MPAGGVEPNESVIEAVKREAKEVIIILVMDVRMQFQIFIQ
ncbi:hypothetical protein B4102_3163 [Heyndrickxia sporothermodurans]|uniref:Nudix hydrolase domain-containing protein n=1 Tax=Heyndrickxia sporothermodurans TaxID=46224 RepID=A0A150L027_9BACI|nr:hypothetical protein B4102_3163 [Heyndrickxia sporothermodurans]